MSSVQASFLISVIVFSLLCLSILSDGPSSPTPRQDQDASSRRPKEFSTTGLMQVAFLLKEDNAGKLHSHRWVFNAFCTQMQPEYVYLVDVGTIPHVDSFAKMFECMEKEPLCGGCCGEIIPYNPDWYNLVVVAQIFEYKVSNVMDKAMESVFGYIPVLPGAFSAYRYSAIEPENYGGIVRGPLVEYFAHFRTPAQSVSALKGNMFLAEDRILCFEIISRANNKWFLRYADGCYGETDVPYRLVDLMAQRRRWLNGAIFAMIYAMKHMGRFFKKSQHSMAVKARILFLCLFYITNLTAFWFALSTALLVLFFVFRSTLSDTTDFAWLHTSIIGVFISLIVLQIFMAFAFEDPRSSKSCRRIYRFISAVHGIIALLFVTQTFILVFFGDDELGLRVIGSLVFGSVAIVAVVAGNGTAWKLLVSCLPYLFMLPTFMLIFPIYSICNLNDLSWGTKGLSKHKYKEVPMLSFFKDIVTRSGASSSTSSKGGDGSFSASAPVLGCVDLESSGTLDEGLEPNRDVEEGWGSQDNPIVEHHMAMKKRTQTLDLFPDFRDQKHHHESGDDAEGGIEMSAVPPKSRGGTKSKKDVAGRKMTVDSRHEGKGSGGIDCGFVWDSPPTKGRTLSQYAAYNKRERKKDKWANQSVQTSDDVEAKYRHFRNMAFLAWVGSNAAFTLGIFFLGGANGKGYLTTVFLFTAAVNTPRLLGALAFYFETRLWVGGGGRGNKNKPDVFRNSFPFLCVGGLLFQCVAVCCSLVALLSFWWTVECSFGSDGIDPPRAPIKTYWHLPHVCLDLVPGGGNCYEYDTVEGLSATVLRSITVIFGELETLPDDYGVYTQASETRFVPALAIVAFATVLNLFTFCMYGMMYHGTLRMWETSSFLMWIHAIVCILTFTSILLVVDSKLYNPSVSELPFCLNYDDPSYLASSTSLEYGPGLVSIAWLLVSSGFQVLVLLLVNIYGTVKSAAAVRKAAKSIQTKLSISSSKDDRIPGSPSSVELAQGVPRSDSEHTQRTKTTITWLVKAAMLEMVFVAVASLTAATSWFQLSCYSGVVSDGPTNFFDRTVAYYSLLEVCFFKPYPYGDCFSYDGENSPFASDKSKTFDPMAAMVLLAVITHLVLFVFFSFFSAAQIFANHFRQCRGTLVDRALHLENNVIPMGALSLLLLAACLHLITIIVLTTSDIFHSSVEDVDFCSALGAMEIPGGVGGGGGGGGDVFFFSPRALARDVGPATALTVILFLCTLGELISLAVKLDCLSAFTSGAT